VYLQGVREQERAEKKESKENKENKENTANKENAMCLTFALLQSVTVPDNFDHHAVVEDLGDPSVPSP